MTTIPIDFKKSITEDPKDLDNILVILNSLRDVNKARLAIINEAEKRKEE